MKKKYIISALVLILLFVALSADDKDLSQPTPEAVSPSTPHSESEPASPDTVSVTEWVDYKNNPIITYGDAIKNTVWNDPSVIKIGDTYHMWLTNGNPAEWPIKVRVHHALSDDGINWDIDTKPVLEPGSGENDWDNLRTETPSVIIVNGTYHLYYSGCNVPCNDGKYNIGHATSKDGITWKKDPENPIITHQNDDPLQWGFYTAVEPAVVYNENEKTFYLYYASAQSRYPEKGTSSGILLSTSKDGSVFTPYTDSSGNKKAVHTLSDNYEYSTHRGVSTPMVYIDDGVYHLYYDIVRDPEGFDQIAISHATSPDGKNFTEIESDIVVAGDGWKNKETLGPTVINDNGTIKMWYAGHTKKVPPKSSGIGYIEKSL